MWGASEGRQTQAPTSPPWALEREAIQGFRQAPQEARLPSPCSQYNSAPLPRSPAWSAPIVPPSNPAQGGGLA